MIIALDRVQRRFLAPFAIDQAKGPVLHIEPPGKPLVCPSEDHGPSYPHLKACSYLPSESLSLKLKAFPDRINTEPCENQGFVFSQIMEMGEIAAERRFMMKVDVERHEISKINVKILGRREVGVAHQAVGVSRFGGLSEFAQERSDAFRTMPPSYVWGDFVPH